MKSRISIGILVVAVIAIVGLMMVGGGDNNGVSAIVYKSPSCGCCGVYSSYMKKEGYDVVIENIQDMSVIKKELGVPYELESCHTMEVGGYVVEGHVPQEAIQKLLAERPDIKGIGMAGMPSGSPGMHGPKIQEFVVYEITHEGTKGDVFVKI